MGSPAALELPWWEALGIDPIDGLEQRIERFEGRLYHGLLVARALLPTTTFLILAAASLRGDLSSWAIAVWGCIALWTTATVPYLWQRLSWARSLPLAARIEISVLVSLVFLGTGTRAWHLLHSFVPLVFAALFTTERAVRVVGVAIIASLWSVYLVFALWPQAPIETTLAALVPTAIVLATSFLLVYVRRVLDDVATIVAAQKRIADAIAVSRRLLGREAARAAIYTRVADRLNDTTAHLQALASSLHASERGGSEHAQAVVDCVAEIEAAVSGLRLGHLGRSEHPDPEATFATELSRAVVRTGSLGGLVSVEPATWASLDLPLQPQQRAPLQRLIGEALANARKHGNGAIRVFAAEDEPPQLVVENESRRPVRHRKGGLGLESMQDDAQSLGGSVYWIHQDGITRTQMTLPLGTTPTMFGDVDDHSTLQLERTLERRRSAYERAILVARFLFAVLTAVSIQVDRSQHRSLLPALTVTSAGLVVWSLVLLIRHDVVRRLLSRRPGLIWIDGALMTGLILFEAGMASPWMPLSMATLMTAGLYLGGRGSGSIAAAFSLAMLAGYGMMHLLRVDDAGTRAQHLPFGWLLNVSVYFAVATVAAGAGWAFARVREATDAYEGALDEKVELERQAAAAEAPAELRRELHASLQQYVRAGLLRLSLLEREHPRSPQAADIEASLTDMGQTLDQLVSELGRGGPLAAPSSS